MNSNDHIDFNGRVFWQLKNTHGCSCMTAQCPKEFIQKTGSPIRYGALFAKIGRALNKYDQLQHAVHFGQRSQFLF